MSNVVQGFEKELDAVDLGERAVGKSQLFCDYGSLVYHSYPMYSPQNVNRGGSICPLVFVRLLTL
jgi:hypothetical protein